MKEKDHKKAAPHKKGGVKKVRGEAENGNSTNGKLHVGEPASEKQIAKKEKENDVICIIGMHRSGTSLVTRLLNLCGLDLGPSDQLMSGNETNPGGHFENLNFTYKINDSLLQHFEGAWDHPPNLREGWEYDSSIDQIVEEARELVRSFSKSKHWGWKDPRTTLLLPFWKSLVPNLRFVICVRSPLEVAKSLTKRDRIPISSGVHLWQQYMRAAIESTEGSARMFIFYEDLFNDATSEIIRLLDFCGLKKPRNLSKVLDTISPALRHHTNETVELLDEHKLLPEEKLLYIGLRALTTQGFISLASGDNREDMIANNISKFCRLLQQFHEEQIVPQLQSALADKEQQLRKIAESIERDKQTHQQQEERLSELVAQQETLKSELGNLQTLLNEKDRLVTDLTMQQTRLTAESDNLKAKVESQQTKIVEKDENIKQLNIQKKRLTQETQGLQSKIQTQEKILRKKEKQVAHSTIEQGTLTQEVETLQSTIKMQQQALNEKKEQIVGLKAEKVQSARDARSLGSKVQAQQMQLNGKEEQVAKLTTKQQQMVDEVETLRSMIQMQEQTLNKQLKDQEVQFAQQKKNLDSSVQAREKSLNEKSQQIAQMADLQSNLTNQVEKLEKAVSQKEEKVKFILEELRGSGQKHKDLQQTLNRQGEQIDLLRVSEHAQQKELVEKELLLGRLISSKGHLTNELQVLQKARSQKSGRVKFVLSEMTIFQQKLKMTRLALQQKEDQIEKLEATLASQEHALAKSGLQVAEIQSNLETRDQTLKQRNDQLRDHVVEKEQLKEVLQVISNSFGWQLTTKLHYWENKVLPKGSLIRRSYDLFWTAMKTLVFRGWTVFVYESKSKLKEFRKNGKRPRLKKPSAFQPLTFKEVENPKVSIIIPVFNQSHYTYQCLKSILENTPENLYEIIVVDDLSTDNTQELLKKIRNVKVINNAENLGFLINCNNGSKVAKGNYILYLNNDTEVTQGWLTAMLSTFESLEKVGAVGAKLIYPNGKLQEAGGIIWKDGSGWNYGKMDDAEKPEYNYVREVDYCSAACLMVRADLLLEIDYFDERYIPGYFEDTDLAFSIREQGCRVIYQPEAVVIHHEGISAGTDLTKGFKMSQAGNRAKFVEKWQSVLEKEHFLPPDQLTDPISFIAKEKCRHKRILIVDHYVPEFDKDSGSLRMFEYINIIVQLGHKVVFLPDNRFRSMPYSQRLQQVGVEVLFGHFDFEDYIVKFGKFFDVAILSRPHIAIKYLEIIRRHTNIFIMYDTVDLGYIREKREAELLGDVQGVKRAEALKRTELFLASQSDLTIVVSNAEKETLLEEDRSLNVEMIPHVHRPVSSIPGFDERDNLMFIGGFQHSPNVDGIVWFVERIFPKIQESQPGIKLYIIGSQPPEEVLRLNNEGVIVTGYLPDVDPHFTSCRVFVAPLRYGAGINGKILHSMSYGLPVVTTNVGAEGLNLKDFDTAMVADQETEFSEKVLKLYSERQLWEKLSYNSIECLRRTHTSEKCMEKIDQILSSINQETREDSPVCEY